MSKPIEDEQSDTKSNVSAENLNLTFVRARAITALLCGGSLGFVIGAYMRYMFNDTTSAALCAFLLVVCLICTLPFAIMWINASTELSIIRHCKAKEPNQD